MTREQIIDLKNDFEEMAMSITNLMGNKEILLGDMIALRQARALEDIGEELATINAREEAK